jgi:hypothetical protein
MPLVDAFSWNLIPATAGVAITHTLLGPEHYLPLIMVAMTLIAFAGLTHLNFGWPERLSLYRALPYFSLDCS